MNHRDTARDGREPVPHSEGRLTCSCGQELDICRHAHCPRCGHRVQRRELAHAGA